MKAWHTFRSSFYRKQTTLQMKTADHKIIDSKLVETRRLMMLETSPWCQPIQELSMSWSPPAPWTLKLLSILSRVGHPVFRALVHCGPLCLAKQLKLLFTTSPKTLFVTSEQKWSFCNSIIKVYSEQLFANKMNNLDEMDIFLEINNFHKKRKYRPKSTDENRFKNSQQNIIKLNIH